MGGDEFAILLTVRVDRTVAKKIAVRIIRAIAAPLLLEGEAIEQQLSVGIVAVDHGQHPSDPEAILRDADVAMYQAKRAGKGSHAFFRADMPPRAASAR